MPTYWWAVASPISVSGSWSPMWSLLCVIGCLSLWSENGWRIYVLVRRGIGTLSFSLSHCFLSLSSSLSLCCFFSLFIHRHRHTHTENAIHAHTHIWTWLIASWDGSPQHWALTKHWSWTFCCQSHPNPAEYHHKRRLRLPAGLEGEGHTINP